VDQGLEEDDKDRLPTHKDEAVTEETEEDPDRVKVLN